ncbi:MAG TPA: type VI secretion system protein TssA [Stellaceae bacterium]|nr:type VI secretion system protein TssA [Stellaceae bacterium]
MATIELERLLEDISPDAPCGGNLEYDSDFVLLEQSARGKPEQQFGNTIIPAEEPDWAAVRRIALDLSKRTRDLRVMDYLARASIRTHGYAGLNDVLTLLRRALERYWEPIHPQLDPDDDNDPTARVNIIGSLCDAQTMLAGIRMAPLVQSRALGRFGLRDISIASGETQPPAAMDAPPTMQAIEGAFLDSAIEELQATADAVRSALEQTRAIEGVVTEKVGTGNAASLDPLSAVLKDASRAIETRLAARGVGTVATATEVVAVNGHATNGSAASFAVAGQLQSRDEVMRLLDKICEYYARYEPSSPVPLLLQRAKKLVPMDFMEIMKDLIPDAVATAEMYRGRLPE